MKSTLLKKSRTATRDEALRSRAPYGHGAAVTPAASSGRALVSVVVVSWNSEDVIEGCLSSVFETIDREGIACEVIVVDNSSSDTTCDLVQQYSRAVLVRNLDNIGFAPASNRAIAQATGEYVLLLNPDARLTPGAITALQAALVANPEAGCAGPSIVDADGKRNPFAARRFPSLGNVLARQFMLRRIAAPLRHLETSGDAPSDRTRSVPCLSGAALLIPRRVVERVGLLDERLPMYFEDIEYCARLEGLGLTRLFVPRATVVHAGRASASKSDKRSFLMALEDGQAPWLYFRLFRGRAQAVGFTAIVALGSTIRLATLRALRALPFRFGTASYEAEHLRARALLNWSLRSKWSVLAEAREQFEPGIRGTPGLMSVLVHNLNREEMLRNCLDSVARQTVRPLEVIVLDAGSEDGSIAVIEQAAKRMSDGGIDCRVVRCESLGVAASRNLAASHATGEFLCAIDNDAVFADDGALSRAREAFESDEHLGVLSFQVLDHDSEDLDPKAWVFRRDPAAWRQRQFDTFTFAGTGFCARAVAFRVSGGFWDHLQYSREEEDLALAMIDRGWRLRYSPEVAIRHYSASQGRMAWEARRFTELRNGILVLWRRFPIPLAAGFIALRISSMGRTARQENVPIRPLARAVPAAIREWLDAGLERQPVRWKSAWKYLALNAERSA